MKRRDFLKQIAVAAAGIALGGAAVGGQRRRKRPNVVVIVSDDQGYADVGFQDRRRQVRTPVIDRLAQSGIRMTNGYASAYVCAPTRAGLLTGRYQQRFGFYRAPDSRVGLPRTERTIADLLKQAGYATGCFGKWHLGLEPAYHPLRRGFDEFYGFLGHGAHDYFDLTYKPDQAHNAIYRNDKIIDDTGYLTDNLAREACAFIERHRHRPFFLYLPFNAVHWPLQAPDEDVRRFDTGDPGRDILMGMIRRMDEAVGRVMQTLRETGVYDNTLVFYFSDNGGAVKNRSNNTPLRDYKHSCYEGGIRVPFCVSWPGRLEPGVSHEPVISLDIAPTICAAVGIDPPTDRPFDGRNMLDILRGRGDEPLHEYLVWDGNDDHWAVREGKWKLLYSKQGRLELFDLDADIGEKRNLAADHPDVVKRLGKRYRAWRDEMAAPMRRKKTKKPRQRKRRQ
jgi:arylsulfatase A-like enzyme